MRSEQYHLKLIIMIPDSSAHCSRDTRAQREFDRRLTERKTPFDEVRLALREKEYYYVVLVLVESNTFRFFLGHQHSELLGSLKELWNGRAPNRDSHVIAEPVFEQRSIPTLLYVYIRSTFKCEFWTGLLKTKSYILAN